MQRQEQFGLTLVELMVALAIGSFLVIGAVQIYNQSRQAFVINESIARVQETAQFAMDTIEADLRMASNWGQTSRAATIEGRALPGDDDPKSLIVAGNTDACGSRWVLDLAVPVDGENNSFGLPCAAQGGAMAQSDLITVRRASALPQLHQPGRLQIQSTRIQGEIFSDGTPPPNFEVENMGDPLDPDNSSFTHNLFVTSYYVGQPDDDNLIPGVPTLRRKALLVVGGNSTIVDQEVAPGVENLQVQLGIDVDEDNTVDRYVNPGDEIYDPSAAGYVPGARVLTARIWLVVRGVSPEIGIQDNATYAPGDVNLGTYSDDFRRLQVSKTILLRNTRT
ncbi:MAG: PilW family protein [Woeseiaceae bacterium]|nr:PilW family protein [Woeseiaceae bacterium]